MPAAYRLKRRVQFYETDSAGIVHFSWFYRYMEEAEHALWRAAGLSIAAPGTGVGFPRVAASFDFRRPLRFEDQFEVHIRIVRIGDRSITYAADVTKDGEAIASGSLTIACVRRQAGQPLAAVDIPPDIVRRLGAASGRRHRDGRFMTRAAEPVPAAERQPRAALAAQQAERLRRLLLAIDGRNPFYTAKLRRAGIAPADLVLPRDLARLPLTTKAELVADQDAAPPWGTVLTYPVERYTRYNQTSSTTGRPLRWLDTAESWQWMLDCWRAVYRGARVGADDRILFPFSFGPFLGFWTAFDAGTQLGAHCVPAGGMTSEARLALIDVVRPTVICCTPTYALRLVEVARQGRGAGPPLADSSVRVLIVAGEPGGSIPTTREQIERGWGARVIDHHGLTEVGPVSFECWDEPGAVHLNECEYIGEVLDPDTGQPVRAGEPGELVLTNLGRAASPLIRYRTGDLVVLDADRCVCGRTLARLDGGIRSRIDDMVHVSGVNVYPTAIEAVLRAVAEVVEYRATIASRGALRAVSVEVELDPSVAQPEAVCRRTEQRLRAALGLTVPVTAVPAGSLAALRDEGPTLCRSTIGAYATSRTVSCLCSSCSR